MQDHSTFLKAAALLAEERRDARFVCIGDGSEPYKKEMHELAAGLEAERLALGQAARARIVAEYSREKLVARTERRCRRFLRERDLLVKLVWSAVSGGI